MAPQTKRKICVMGFRAVGKSTITIQYVDKHCPDTYNPTIENTFQKVIKLGSREYSTEIIDTAGQDEYSILQKQYSVGIHGYILVYSVTSASSLEVVKVLNDKILNALGTEKIPRVLVGNKSDLEGERQISKEEAQSLANKWECAFCECSGKNNVNVEEVFKLMLQEIDKSQQPEQQQNSGLTIK
ncbi:Ras GTPase [Heterostelium album PN500]|uniref:Ras GTPase n=1 Tax=Heterostelium pallidum (strain ATCC 26659 / Pp 5 / PN500) TaxID=670386 RepID=D3BEU9_HETP5|nr:Ras GTPase [Heterostelium album PN500]EFA80430.1 Ras GTPase [Heterostelium album PN500]|eukprot:XP_020432550.1 Ras GTPase [Heterostelium album PN500]